MRKRRLSVIILSAVLGIGLLGGCESRTVAEGSSKAQSDSAPDKSAQSEATQEPEQTPASDTEGETLLPEDFPMEFSFSSGVGAWRTDLTLNRDGSFQGVYEDADLSEISYSEFSGQFRQIEKVNPYTYSMKLDDLKYKYKTGKKWKEDGESYTAADAYGLEKGKTFYLYTPQAPREKLPKKFLDWDQAGMFSEKKPEKLGYYGLYNKKMGYGFFASPEK